MFFEGAAPMSAVSFDTLKLRNVSMTLRHVQAEAMGEQVATKAEIVGLSSEIRLLEQRLTIRLPSVTMIARHRPPESLT
jgi:hypothetical protein